MEQLASNLASSLGSTDSEWARRLATLSGRPLTAIFDLSNRCNLRCRQCYFSYDSVFHRRPVFLNATRFERIAQQILPLAHTLYLSAATEPFASPHFIPILEVASRFAPLQIKLITNAILLRKQTAEALVEHDVSEVHVSIDGGIAETYEYFRRGARFDTLLRSLDMLNTAKQTRGASSPLLQFNVTLMRRNLDELEMIVALAVRYGVARIACRHLILYADLGMEEESLSLDPLRANERLHGMLERARREGIDVVNFPNYFAIDGREWVPAAAATPSAEHEVDAVIEADRFAQGPLGHVDGPLHPGAESSGLVSFHGWALDRRGPVEVELFREPFVGESDLIDDPSELVPIGKASFQNGTRPDVVRHFPDVATATRAGWEFLGEVTDPGWREGVAMVVHAFATNGDGQRRPIGPSLSIRRTDAQAAKPWLYCHYPFDSVFVGPDGQVFPYPDCQGIDPYGVLLGESRFEELWFGATATDLRERIIRRDPPEMCQRCAVFLNRRVDDALLFQARPVEPRYLAPSGAIDAPSDGATCVGDSIEVRGWAAGFSPVVRVEVQRRVEDGEVVAADEEGFVLLGAAVFEAGSLPPDVEVRHRPRIDPGPRWRFQLDRSGFSGPGASRLRVVAVNREGQRCVLGERGIQFVWQAQV